MVHQRQPVPAQRDAWIEVDLDAVRANAALLAGLLPSGTELAPVVKADAYGHGAPVVAGVLEAAGHQLLCVATLEEGLALRTAGITARVLLLYQPPGRAWTAAADARLEVGVTSSEGLELAIARAAQPGLPRLHLKVDTGMTRQGLLPADVERAARQARTLAPSVAAIWTHLSDGADPVATAAQLQRFDAAVDALAEAGISAPRHVGASASILAGLAGQYEIARPGLALFGMTPAEALEHGVQTPRGLRPALGIYARPVRLAEIATGTPVGYGGTFVTRRPTLLATLPLGYGDGIFRSLGNGAWEALVHGQRVPIVGRISMDGITVDVTDVEGVDVGDRFTLIGADGTEELTVNDMAVAAGTIPQEVLIRLANRLPHFYRGDAVT